MYFLKMTSSFSIHLILDNIFIGNILLLTYKGILHMNNIPLCEIVVLCLIYDPPVLIVDQYIFFRYLLFRNKSYHL